MPRRPETRPRRLLCLTGAALFLGALLAACGGSGHRVDVGGPATTATSAPGTPRPAPTGPHGATCRANALRADQVPISAGTSQYYLAWSLTNVSSSTCALAPGRPGIRFLDAAGRSVVRYTVSQLPAGSAPVVLAPGRAGWFLTEELGNTCGSTTVVTGGPFHYRISLPGGAVVTWAPGYLAAPTLGSLCPAVTLAVGGIQSSRPAP